MYGARAFLQIRGIFLYFRAFKTELGLWIGTNRHNHKTKVKDKDIEWPDKIKALGVWFTLDAERSQLLNYKERSEKISKIINDCSHQRMTLVGKITVIKSLLASQLKNILSPLRTNIKYIESIQKELFAFLWDGKNDKIERTQIINNYAEGGLKMLDLKTFSRSLKFTWIQKYLSSQNNAKWKTFFDYRLKRYGGSFLFWLAT